MVKIEKDRRLNARLKLKIGQKVIFPKMIGELMRPRPATIIAEYPTFYLARTEGGYTETIHRYGSLDGVKL